MDLAFPRNASFFLGYVVCNVVAQEKRGPANTLLNLLNSRRPILLWLLCFHSLLPVAVGRTLCRLCGSAWKIHVTCIMHAWVVANITVNIY